MFRNVRWLFIVACLLLLTACEKEQKRIDDFFVTFATTILYDSGYRFALDNGDLVVPEDLKDFDGTTGQRVVINYTPISDNRVKVNNISKVFTDNLRETDMANSLKMEPVKLQSVWIAGRYLNLIIETMYHSQPHAIALYRDITSTDYNLYLSYSRNNDAPGSSKMIYASFYLGSILGENKKPSTLFFNINTVDGLRKIELTP
jgi:hypothetical protein